jgi:cytochrome c1
MRCSIISKRSSKRLTTFAVVVAALTLAGCAPPENSSHLGGDAKRGRFLAVQHGCATCHTIPRAPTRGLVGPPLSGVGKRAYLAGRVPNTPENMVRWIRFPQQIDPDTMMPDMRISETDGRDLTAFLYALR